MAMIEDLLHRRTDLSTFLVHLTRDSANASARDNLLSIADNNSIEARSAFGPAARLQGYLDGTPATQKVVCFSETPLEHTWMMLEDIERRAVHFKPYGLAITKTTARKTHVNPVWYSDISTRGGRDWPATAVNQMIDQAMQRSTMTNGQVDIQALSQEPVFKITPFLEQMGPQKNGAPKEFWWEREWRHIGDYRISVTRMVAVLAPADDHDALRKELTKRNKRWSARPIIDPRWGLERMIAALADIDEDDIGPFPAA